MLRMAFTGGAVNQSPAIELFLKRLRKLSGGIDASGGEQLHCVVIDLRLRQAIRAVGR